MSSFTTQLPPANWLLAGLPRKEYRHLLPMMEQTDLSFGSTLYEPGDVIRHVYFPTSGVVSLLATGGNGTNLEVGIVGREGMIGLPVFMGVKTSHNLAVIQGSGSALRMKATAFRKECTGQSSLPVLLQRYTHWVFTQLSQSAVCNRFHQIDRLRMLRDNQGRIRRTSEEGGGLNTMPHLLSKFCRLYRVCESS